MPAFERLSKKIVREDRVRKGAYDEMLQSLNPVFYDTPALAFNSCYEILKTMLYQAINSVHVALENLKNYDQEQIDKLMETETDIDTLTDNVGMYLVRMSPYVVEDNHILILNQYNRLVNEFERIGDHAVNIADVAVQMHETGMTFSNQAIQEIGIAGELLDTIFEYTVKAFENRDVEAAWHIEPLEDVMDDLTHTLHDNHLARLREGECTITGGMAFIDVLTNMERLSDICSNVGISVVARVRPELASLAHNYVTSLHEGDLRFKKEYRAKHQEVFDKLELIENPVMVMQNSQ